MKTTYIQSLLKEFQVITLAEMEKVRLINRIDTKYTTQTEALIHLLGSLKDNYFVQMINNNYISSYQTIYLDTINLSMYIAHQDGKSTHEKIQMRCYLDSHLSFLEIKDKDNKGRTRKQRILLPTLIEYKTNEASVFLNHHSLFKPNELFPQIENSFSRITLVNYEKTEWLTVDTDICFHNLTTGKTMAMSDLVIIELKQDSNIPSFVKNLLHKMHVCPISINYYFTFTLINVSVFLLVFLLGSVKLKIGFALGIFAIFGIIRYRTESVPIREMTYLFIIIAISVINGLSVQISYGKLLLTNILFILATWLMESERWLKHVSCKLILYDKIQLITPDKYEELMADLKKRTGLNIKRLEIGQIDFLRDSAFIKVYYEPEAEKTNSIDSLIKFPYGSNDEQNYESPYYTKIMKIRHTINLISGLFLCLPLFAQNDWGSSLSAGVSKKLTSKLNLSLEEDFRTHNNFSEAERFSTGLDLSYKLNDYLKFGGAYNLINYNHKTNGWEVRHRYYFYGTGSFYYDRFTLSLRERFQSTYRVGIKETDTRSNPKLYLRSRLELDYNIAKSNWKPFVSVELYKPLNDKVDNKMNKVRYTVGTDYKLNKHNSLELFYRYNNFIDDEENDDQQVIGLGYVYKF